MEASGGHSTLLALTHLLQQTTPGSSQCALAAALLDDYCFHTEA